MAKMLGNKLLDVVRLILRAFERPFKCLEHFELYQYFRKTINLYTFITKPRRPVFEKWS